MILNTTSLPFRFCKLLSSGLFLMLLILFSNARNAGATHASGSDLTYTWVTGNTYKVTVSFYRDCAGVAAPNSITLNARSSSCNRNQSYTLNRVPNTGQEITFACFAAATKCTNSSSIYPGYQRYVYEANVTLPQLCSDWVLSYFVCCRNCAITTLNNPCDANMYVEATLNNVLAPTNSSPQFTNIPVAFLCVNQNFTYNHGVVDPNGDSLVYSFVTPKTYNSSNNTVGNVSFRSGYSATSPLTSSPAVSLNSANGDITMRPTANNEIGVTAILVREFRNGVQIGSIIRDMQFITTSCSLNFLPSATGINGSNVFSAVACPGSTLSFNINTADANAADSVFLTWNAGIPGATFSTTSSTRPVGTFTWTPTAAQSRPQPYTFTVTVRDNACPTNGTQTYSFSISVPLVTATASSPLFNGYNVPCNGLNGGSATVTPSGGSTPYTYLWMPSGQTTQTATSLGAGTYTVTVTDANGCSSQSTLTLTQPPTAVSSSIAASTDVSCMGGSDGTATASGSGGVSPYTYSWNPSSQTAAIASGLSANSYTVTVTDNNGCTSQSNVTIGEPTALNGSIAGFTNVTCNGNSNGTINTSVSGGTPPYSHSWSNGASTQNISGIGPGTYADTIRDSKGCLVIVTQVITEPGGPVGIPSSSISVSDVLCNGGSTGSASLSPSGGTMPYTITWSNGDVGNTADTLSAGVYSVTIVDANGCTFDTSVTINEPAVLNAQFVNFSIFPSGDNIACNGDTMGKAKISVFGGAVPYSYTWSTGATIDSIMNVGAGTYWVDIADANGCNRSDTIVLTEPSVFTNFLTKQDVVCKGESSGWVKANPSGGAAPYSFVWTSMSNTTDSIGRIPIGFYEVTITDLNGCQLVDTITVSEPDTLVPLITAIQFFGDVNVPCFGDSSGVVSVDVTGGTAPYSYAWNTGQTTDTITGVPAGTVSVYVRDFNGCSIIGSHALTEPGPFQYASVIQNPLCYADTSGFIHLNASGSTPPFTFAWSNSAATDSIENLSSGTYHVIINDMNGCRDSVGFILSDPDSISSSVATSNYQGFNVSCNGGSDGYIIGLASGGTGTLTYAWSTGSPNDSIGGLAAGIYNVTITDGNGCTKDTSVTLDQPLALVLTLSAAVYSGGVNVSCYGYNDGVGYSFVTGGVPPYQYNWSNGDQADSALGLFAGPYSLMVTDSNGCNISNSINLTEPVPVALTATLSDYNGFNVPCNGDSVGCITVLMSGGVSPFSYLWDIQDTLDQAMICNLPADTIFLRAQDANGCVLDTTFVLTAPPVLSSTATSTNASCSGLNNGTATAIPAGGVSPYTVAWSNGDSGFTADSLGLGYVTYTVTDFNFCQYTDSINVSQPVAISSGISVVTDVSCFGGSDAVVSVSSASGGTAPYTYAWSNGDTGLSADSVQSGNISVTITDANNCTLSLSTNVSQPAAALDANASTQDVSCFGFSDGSATILPFGGTPNYTYAWTPGSDSTATVNNLSPGNYSVMITDSRGCVHSVNVIISQPQALTANAGADQSTCNSEVRLNASLNQGFTGSWASVSSGPVFSNPSSPSSLVSQLGNGNTVLTWTITDGTCSAVDTLVVSLQDAASCELELPTGFSPNGDGFNDGYFVKGLDRYPENVLTVFNRWGNEVYKKENYVNNEWTGQNNNGDELPDGTYFVVLIISNQDIRLNDFVDLRRNRRN
ncbi:MAG: hypothetical protein DWQ44_06855 [Bacteroidetes bacterium]|nr:MAG: hypothetical protein DWQ33_13740 [Bacteroidota bacterium]REK06925.1 MAG: hypothetical protein DWQ39_01855 [Bacteroidota bacterium]REK34349.1 MAG: hypothetical protein DWQ44_06855 [Bacteroidota bacterium]